MALTLEAALVFPVSISLIFGLIPPAAHEYRLTVQEAAVRQRAAALTADPERLYALAPVTVGTVDGKPDDRSEMNVLMTSPKQMFCLVTAALDDLELLGVIRP